MPIVYYGRPGLESDIFVSYMRHSGYPVQVVPLENGNLPDVVNLPASVAVVSLDRTADQTLHFIREIRNQTEDCVKIFVIADLPTVEPEVPAVEIVNRPNHLGAIVKKIQGLSRTGV
ncbi:MAG: hypothetical protein ACM3JD_15735 [Rudaea sp.]